MKKIGDRIIWVDLLRICAMWGVICIHVGSSVEQPVKGTTQYIAFLLQGTPLNCCVPLFYMLSGMLILQRLPDIKKIWTQKIPRLVAAIVMRLLLIVTLILVVALMGYIVYGRSFRWEVFQNFAARDNMFLYSLIGLYAVAPLLYLICSTKKYEEYFLILSFVFSIVVPTLEKIPVTASLSNHIFFYTSVYLPLGYPMLFILGHYLAQYVFQKIKKYKSVITLLMILGIIVDYYIRIRPVTWLQIGAVSYGSICELIVSIPIFCFFGIVVSEWKPQNQILCNHIRHMGRNSIAIFILHWTVINFDRAIGIIPSWGHYLIGRPLETTVIFFVCYYLSLIWERIPVLNKIITV